MRITPIQDHIFWADKAANLSKVYKQIADLKGQTDLVVLPEMFSTGFCTNQPDLSETMDGDTMRQLADWAKQFQLAITGSFIADNQGFLYNRAFFVFPTGEISWADKRHLFGMSDEKTFFKSGLSPLLVEYYRFNIQVLVCYDVRFPVWARNVDNRYDLLIYVANFPDRRIADWDILLKARAIENQTITDIRHYSILKEIIY
jgi:predicted amidohydrolase